MSKSAFVEPLPSPSCRRAPVIACNPAMRWASSTGWRTGTCSTQVPISIRLMTAAMTLISTIGSRVGRPRPNESVTHNPVKPFASTWRERSLMRSSVFPVVSGVGRNTLTTCTLISPVSALSIVFLEETLGEPGEKADANGDRVVVEIVMRVMQRAAAFARAVAQPQHRAGHRLQHVGKIFAAERWRDIAVDLRLTADLGGDVGGEHRFGGMVDRRRIAAAV